MYGSIERGSWVEGRILKVNFFLGVEKVGVVLEGVWWPLGVLDEVAVSHLPKIRVFQLDRQLLESKY